MLRSLPVAARTLVWVRILNALGAYALSFLVVLTGLSWRRWRWPCSDTPGGGPPPTTTRC
ncbi:hypothetical protein E1267_21560 [Nonomuraea longispora]|uniref:Uncharacterized protein n=1 Tax=Nonomuraea longispora TaxID=1848320 RepID=A0A4R4N9L5_9ACTN|nr:hypothetical protein [Nonomuraea longispora]TDC04824.1 hypothetical protein E1267_21560 [Nonomuraea longispora]